MKRRHLIAAAGSAALLPAVARAQVIDLNDAINKAGRQRMLSQRMAKSYSALGQGVLPDLAGEVLAASMGLFDRQLVELKVFAPTPEIKRCYVDLEQAWGDYKAVLVGAKPARERAAEMFGAAGGVLKLAHQGTGLLEKQSGKSLGRLVNIAGRQRMLSQRMAAFYLSASWGVDVSVSTKELATARDEFVQAHQVLFTAPEATPQIKTQLDLADQQFVFFAAALRNLRPGQSDARLMTNVFTTSERILQLMDGVTGMFSKQGLYS
ncbi:type IV pili methyl-accepting chemotaxis transducer N-terminal domain-containing protein [Aquincola sp. S2]|uniref:Type IV pili methyl-accepting chemotaxis transducer N-terminal domain-containing protein n=1 Tax=Pseudaquabacterium terrae TaxID=2732868 RepID=A0ABX2EPE5_9BURK|nr:type IV pili methyl-accepting chemotaxis transducer N-terminal domain-containing protein [Aquabacterium terrae]NRF70453.1 type IV pili methyl-accepting chemotaxis transducer N-terminal domain-containing protein [Aquabacterium terrae]